MMIRLVAVLLLAPLTGCAAPADTRWHKPGTDTAALERDLSTCTQEARLQARRAEVPSAGLATLPGAPPVIGTDTQGRPVQAPRHPRETDRFLAEHDLTRICMRARGYERIPVEAAGRR